MLKGKSPAAFFINLADFIGRGSQGASRAAPGKSGLHARGEGERVMALESREGLGPRDALKKDSRGLSRGAAGNPRFPGLLPGTLGNFTGCL